MTIRQRLDIVILRINPHAVLIIRHTLFLIIVLHISYPLPEALRFSVDECADLPVSQPGCLGLRLLFLDLEVQTTFIVVAAQDSGDGISKRLKRRRLNRSNLS